MTPTPDMLPASDFERAARRFKAAMIEMNDAYSDLIAQPIPGLARPVTQEAEQGHTALDSRSSRDGCAGAGTARTEAQ